MFKQMEKTLWQFFGITKGEKVGKILERMYRDALMNRFNWRDRQTTLEYVSNLKM